MKSIDTVIEDEQWAVEREGKLVKANEPEE